MNSIQQSRARVEAFAEMLDEAFAIPGTRIRIGWDGLIGLIPGIGDLVSTLMSLYILTEAARAGAPASVLTRMLGNVAADSIVGGIPLAGDVLDFFFKANRANSRLLLEWMEQPGRVQRRSRWQIVLIIGIVLALMVGLISIAVLIALWIARALGFGA